MSRSSRDTGHSCVSRSRDRRISTRSCPSGCPCHLASSPKSWRRPLSPWENKVCAFSTTSTTGSYSHSLASSCLHTGTWCSSTSACWARRFALPSHVATRPPPPPLESEASEVPSCHPHPRSVQSGSRRAVSISTSRRVETPSPGGSADLGTVRSCSGRPVCISRNHPLPRVLLPNRGNARHGCTGTQLAPGPAQICVPPSEPTSTDTVQDQGGRGAGFVSGSILAQQDLVPGTHAPHDSPSLANSSEEGSAFSETGHPMAPAPGPVETPRMVPGWDAEVLADLPQEVALTITSARTPSTRRAYTLKWNLFVEWCSSHQEDPRRCSIRAVLSFLQQGEGSRGEVGGEAQSGCQVS